VVLLDAGIVIAQLILDLNSIKGTPSLFWSILPETRGKSRLNGLRVGRLDLLLHLM
jgi:hypothetical protein